MHSLQEKLLLRVPHRFSLRVVWHNGIFYFAFLFKLYVINFFTDLGYVFFFNSFLCLINESGLKVSDRVVRHIKNQLKY